MQFNILTIFTTVALVTTVVHGAEVSSLTARQSSCSVTSGCNCLTGSVTAPIIGNRSVDSCTGGRTCSAAGSPVAGSVSTVLGSVVFSMSLGGCT
ncbi:hypothetical protein QCA50_013184 [Cerrena zonata]|uniref:Uncharacterized protein n=1 Tax=Cerrena zonata TaxID=2478898 RepID=A0AAW0G1L7_9APHY